MKIKSVLLSILATLLVSGCKNKNKQEEYKEDLTPDYVIDAKLYDTLESIEDKSCYNIKLNYTDKYFKYTASTFKKDLMMLSFGATNSMAEKELGEKFFSGIGFSTIYTVPNYDGAGTEDSVRYMIAKKVIDDFTVFAVSFKGNNYGQEWANNLNLGPSGDHEGFMLTATKVYNNLLNYISGEHNYKLWISGYSRGGALSNVLSYLLLNNPLLPINEDNLYTYTFAATRGLTLEHAKPYKNVFNLYNSADLLSNFAPDKYGLYRCGTDIDIFNDHLDEYIPSFSSQLEIEKFNESKNVYKNDKEFTKYFLNELLKEDTSTFNPDKYPYDVSNREHFYQIQNEVSYLLSHILGMPGYMIVLKDEFKDTTSKEAISYLSDDGEKLCEKLKEIFDKNAVDYDEDYLMHSCQATITLLKRYSSLLIVALSNTNVTRMIKMHYTELVYILIQKV